MRDVFVNGDRIVVTFNYHRNCYEFIRVSDQEILASCDPNELAETVHELEEGESNGDKG